MCAACARALKDDDKLEASANSSWEHASCCNQSCGTVMITLPEASQGGKGGIPSAVASNWHGPCQLLLHLCVSLLPEGCRGCKLQRMRQGT